MKEVMSVKSNKAEVTIANFKRDGISPGKQKAAMERFKAAAEKRGVAISADSSCSLRMPAVDETGPVQAADLEKRKSANKSKSGRKGTRG